MSDSEDSSVVGEECEEEFDEEESESEDLYDSDDDEDDDSDDGGGPSKRAKSGKKQTMVPIGEMTEVLKVTKDSANIKVGQWVRLKRGLFKDDLAQVDYLDTAQNQVHLKLIPRIDNSRLRGALRNTENEAAAKRKRFKRPAAKLFDQDAVRAIGGEVSTDGDFTIFESNRYRRGFLYKQFNMNTVLVDGVKPTLSELEKFEEHPEGIEIQLSETTTAEGDQVEVCDADLWTHFTFVGRKNSHAQVQCEYCGKKQRKTTTECRHHLIRCKNTPNLVRRHYLLKENKMDKKSLAKIKVELFGDGHVDDLWTHWTIVSGKEKIPRMQCKYCLNEQRKKAPKCRHHLIKCKNAPDPVRHHFQQIEEEMMKVTLETKVADASLAGVDFTKLSGDESAVVASTSSADGQSCSQDVGDLWTNWTFVCEKGRNVRVKCKFCGSEQYREAARCRLHLIKCKNTPDPVRNHFLMMQSTMKVELSGYDSAVVDSISSVTSSSSNTGNGQLEAAKYDLDAEWAKLRDLPAGDPLTDRAVTWAGEILGRGSRYVRNHAGKMAQNFVAQFPILYRFHQLLPDPSTKQPYELAVMDQILTKYASLVPPPSSKPDGTLNEAVSVQHWLRRYDQTLRAVFVHDQKTRLAEAAPLAFARVRVGTSGDHSPSEALLKVYLKNFALYKGSTTYSDIRTSDTKAPKIHRSKLKEILTWATQQIANSFFVPLEFEQSLIPNPSDLFPTCPESELLKRSLKLPDNLLSILTNRTVYARHLFRLVEFTKKIDGLMVPSEASEIGLTYILAECPTFVSSTAGPVWTPVFWLICLWYAGYTGWLSAYSRRSHHARQVKQGESSPHNPRLYRHLLASVKGGRAVHWIPILPGLSKSTATAHLHEMALIRLSKLLGGGFNCQSGNSSLIPLPILESIPEAAFTEIGVTLLVRAFYSDFDGTELVPAEPSSTTIDLWKVRRNAILVEDEQEMAAEATKPRTIEEILATFK